MQRATESDFEDENEICYTSKRRAHPIPQHYDEDSFPSSSWTNQNENELEEDQCSSSIDYYHNEEEQEDDDIEDDIFSLPPSSNDLLVTPQQALHLATIYEFLRHFSPILRLSPFIFEHFCTSMVQSSDLNNVLFSQIHICLLRLLIKQDDDDGITYASETDIKGITDLSFVTMDYITWPYILQLYVTSHPQLKSFTLIVKEYPFNTNIEDKISMLSALCDVALTTKTIRREFDDTKPKQHDDNCRQCQKRGDLLCCDRCEATYHLACLNPPLTSVPTIEWFCPVCVQNQLQGVTDCIPPRENRPFYLRHRCIGHDREQRRYWFICRRLFVEDETGDDVRYYSTLDQFDNLLSCLDERGPEKLLVYRLQKRYNDVARCMQITADLQTGNYKLLIEIPKICSANLAPLPIDTSSTTSDDEARLNDDEDRKSLSMFTDGSMPNYFDQPIKLNAGYEYERLIDMIKIRIKSNKDNFLMHGQIDGIADDEKDSKSMVKKREFFINSNNYSSKVNGQNYYSNELPMPNDFNSMSQYNSSNRSLIEERLRRVHNIYSDTQVALRRLNQNDIDETIWQRYEQYRAINRYPTQKPSNNIRPNTVNNTSYPRSNYYRDYYTGNNYEDEDGMLLDNEYDDFGDDFFQQEENIDEFDMPFRKYESNRVYRGTTRGRPRGRGRPPLYGGRAGRGSHYGQPPRGVNHLTTGSFQSHQRFIQPKVESPKSNEQQQQQQQQAARNKRKPAKTKSVPVTAIEEKPKRPGKILRSGRISRKPRRDSETDFGSDNSDDSGAKDKETGSDDDEEFDLTQLGLGFGNASTIVKKPHEGSSSSNDSLAGANVPLTNFAAFAQSQLLATNLANGLLKSTDELSNGSDYSADDFETDESDDMLDDNAKPNNLNTDDEDLDDFTYSQTMLSLIKSMQSNCVKIHLDLVSSNKDANSKGDIFPMDGHLHYENYYQTNPLATRKQMLLNERDRRAHLARKFSINHSPSFTWYAPSPSVASNYSLKNLIDILRLTLVHFENTIPLPFMHSHWKRYRYIWAKQLLDFSRHVSLKKFIHLLLQFETCIKPVSYFDLFTDQVGYLKFRRETEKERDEAKKEEKDAFIRRKIDADALVQNVHFTRPLKHSVHRQRGEEYRLAGGQGWTFVRSTRRSNKQVRKSTFDVNSLLARRENMSNVILNERNRVIGLLEAKLKSDSDKDVENELKNLLLQAKDDNDDLNDDLTFINYKIIEYNGCSYRYPIMLDDTRRPFHLARSSHDQEASANRFQLPVPWTFSFNNQIPPNIFILPHYILRRLARASMTLTDAPGFINSRLSGIGTRFGWPYPCGRPSVRTAWCYKVETSTSFFAIAHHIKYLWNCIRWDLLTEKLSSADESSITTHTDSDGTTTTIQVLAKRDSGPYNSYCEYFVRKTIHPQTNDSSNFNIPISKSRSRAVPHPSSILAPNRLILTEQWLPERQLQPNQIRYYYRRLQEKSFKRLHKKSNGDRKKQKKKTPADNSATAQQPAKPFIVRIPHLQPKSNLSTESGKVVIVKAAGDSSSSNIPLQQKSFSVVKLADGQIILVPTTTVQQNDSAVSKAIKGSPPKSQPQTTPVSPQERRLRPIAPAPMTSIQSSTELLNSLLAQQQQQLLLQQQSEIIERVELPTTSDEPVLTNIAETVATEVNGATVKLVHNIVPKPKNTRKTTPIPSISDEKKIKMDPDEANRAKVCEAILRSIIAKIEREQTVESIQRSHKHLSTSSRMSSNRQLVLTRLLNERIDHLRKDFTTNRLNRKTALVKEQMQTQRLKQQQLILKQQQQQATTVKSKEIIKSDDEKPSNDIKVKKSRKTNENENKVKQPVTTEASTLEQKPKQSNKRTRPLPEPKTSDNDEIPISKKARRSCTNQPTDNDENKNNRKSSPPPPLTPPPPAQTTTIAKMKSTERARKVITIKNSSNKKDRSQEINLSDINCFCERTDIPEKFFIQCELCSRWLHGKCVDLTPRLAEKIKEFICADCKLLTQKAKERLYCVCQKPYDESKFYIGCDVCADWLHGSCVNITPEEADKFEVYVCPRCSTEKKQEFLNKPINNDKQKDLLNLTDQLLAHKMAWPFQKPVDIKDVPNYHAIIKDPMDLTTLRTKVTTSKFKTICDYIRDVNKIFNNCRQFNPINSTFSQCANVVDNYFRQLLENMMTKDDH